MIFSPGAKAKSAFEKFDRREKKLSIGWKRSDDQDPIFNPVEKIIWEFEQKIDMPIEELDISTHAGKQKISLSRFLSPLLRM